MSRFFDVRQKGFPARTAVSVAVESIRSRVHALPFEPVPLLAAHRRALAGPIDAPVSVPAFDRAAYDGYALRAESTLGADTASPVALRVVGESFPGRPTDSVVSGGEAVRIMTGAPMPKGADAVVPFEITREENGRLLIREPAAPGKHVGRVGEDVRAGQRLFERGRVLRPQDVGLLASLGVKSVTVVAVPSVEILVTGDEILPPGSELEPFRIIDSNSPMLEGLIGRDGGRTHPVRYLPDRPESIREALEESIADVILISGGTSVGREDHAPKIVAEAGELHFHGVHLRPASPTGFGTVGKKAVFLLPGNPVSCLCGYDLFARLAIRRLAGLPERWSYPRVALPLGGKVVSAPGRTDYARVRIEDGRVFPLAVSGASMLSSTVRADGFLLVEPDRESLNPGESVAVYLYDGVESAQIDVRTLGSGQ